VISDVLFVKTLLRTARLIGDLGPKPGGIGSEHFINQNNIVAHKTKFKLGIRNDDALFFSLLSPMLIDRQAQRFDRFGRLYSYFFYSLFKIDINIMMSDFCFC